MSKSNDAKYLADMLQYAREATALVAGVSSADYDNNRTLQLALAYLIQIIGEAAYNVSESSRAAIAGPPWERITGMRHRLVHDYGRISFAVVWDVVTNELPFLITTLEKITPPEPPA